VFNGTFNNISVILWQSVLLVEETRVKYLEKTTRKCFSRIVEPCKSLLEHTIVEQMLLYSFFLYKSDQQYKSFQSLWFNFDLI
jgi:hypothetical protein